MRLRIAVVMFGVSLIATACTGGGESIDGTWIVTALEHSGGTISAPEPPDTLTLTVEDDRISGNAGCNSFSGSSTWPGDDVAITSTRVFCGEPIMQQEAAYLGHLANASTVTVEENTMTIEDAAGNITVVLVRGPS